MCREIWEKQTQFLLLCFHNMNTSVILEVLGFPLHIKWTVLQQTPNGCSHIQFHSDTVCLDIGSAPIGWGFSPTTAHTLSCQSQTQVVACACQWPTMNCEFRWPPPWNWLVCVSGSQNTGTHFTYIYPFIREDTTKHTDEHLDGSDLLAEVWERSEELGCILSCILSFLSFHGGPIMEALLPSLALVINWTFIPCALPRGQRLSVTEPQSFQWPPSEP